MNPTPVILIFDVGKTNKKVLLFNEQYHLLLERSAQLPETNDEDGDPCEDLSLLSRWVRESYDEIAADERYAVKAVNFSAYGASLVYLNDYLEPETPLYNYLKPYPESLRRQFYDTYGPEEKIAKETASPALGSLNSGMQLYRLKYEQPDVFARVKYALHLPQYLSHLITGAIGSDITSIGCHTQLWDFAKVDYHEWVYREELQYKLAPIYNGDEVTNIPDGEAVIQVGIGLHDSSAALIPYLANFHEPFILLSTGTWCISLNPFNQSPLTEDELRKDCLCYIGYQGEPVKASRLFSGNEHEMQTRRLADWFKCDQNYYESVAYDPALIRGLKLKTGGAQEETEEALLRQCPFAGRNLQSFASYEEAYHQLILDLIRQQVVSTGLVLQDSPVKRIFVDGGFSKNPVYMHLLAEAFPHVEVFAASIAQATALGAAIAIHNRWNDKSMPGDIIALQYYAVNSSFFVSKGE